MAERRREKSRENLKFRYVMCLVLGLFNRKQTFPCKSFTFLPSFVLSHIIHSEIEVKLDSQVQTRIFEFLKILSDFRAFPLLPYIQLMAEWLRRVFRNFKNILSILFES